MSPVLLPWLALAGALGAGLRYAVTLVFERSLGAGYPYGTTVVNFVGAFGAGMVMGWAARPDAPVGLAVASVGLMGALTTFSTWMVEGVEMWRASRRSWAIAHVLGGLAVGMALALLGLRLVM